MTELTPQDIKSAIIAQRQFNDFVSFYTWIGRLIGEVIIEAVPANEKRQEQLMRATYLVCALTVRTAMVSTSTRWMRELKARLNSIIHT